MIKEEHKAIGTRLLIKVDVLEEFKNSTLAIPREALEREQLGVETGVIMSMGDCAFLGFGDGTPWANKGDRVTFVKHAGRPFRINDEEYRYINDVDLLGKVFKSTEG